MLEVTKTQNGLVKKLIKSEANTKAILLELGMNVVTVINEEEALKELSSSLKKLRDSNEDELVNHHLVKLNTIINNSSKVEFNNASITLLQDVKSIDALNKTLAKITKELLEKSNSDKLHALKLKLQEEAKKLDEAKKEAVNDAVEVAKLELESAKKEAQLRQVEAKEAAKKEAETTAQAETQAEQNLLIQTVKDFKNLSDETLRQKIITLTAVEVKTVLKAIAILQ